MMGGNKAALLIRLIPIFGVTPLERSGEQLGNTSRVNVVIGQKLPGTLFTNLGWFASCDLSWRKLMRGQSHMPW